MCNDDDSQEKSGNGWKIFLERAKQMLAEATTKKRRKELRYSVRAFETLIKQNAAMPAPRKAGSKQAA